MLYYAVIAGCFGNLLVSTPSSRPEWLPVRTKNGQAPPAAASTGLTRYIGRPWGLAAVLGAFLGLFPWLRPRSCWVGGSNIFCLSPPAPLPGQSGGHFCQPRLGSASCAKALGVSHGTINKDIGRRKSSKNGSKSSTKRGSVVRTFLLAPVRRATSGSGVCLTFSFAPPPGSVAPTVFSAPAVIATHRRVPLDVAELFHDGRIADAQQGEI
jgi:hypothetical protein